SGHNRLRRQVVWRQVHALDQEATFLECAVGRRCGYRRHGGGRALLRVRLLFPGGRGPGRLPFGWHWGGGGLPGCRTRAFHRSRLDECRRGETFREQEQANPLLDAGGWMTKRTATNGMAGATYVIWHRSIWACPGQPRVLRIEPCRANANSPGTT